LLFGEPGLAKHPGREGESLLDDAIEDAPRFGIRLGPVPDRQIEARQPADHDLLHEEQDAFARRAVVLPGDNDGRISHLSLPVVQKRIEQFAAVLEVPVETPGRHAQIRRQRRDFHLIDAGRTQLECRLQPVIADQPFRLRLNHRLLY
jgi:hypothetical protein